MEGIPAKGGKLCEVTPVVLSNTWRGWLHGLEEPGGAWASPSCDSDGPTPTPAAQSPEEADLWN